MNILYIAASTIKRNFRDKKSVFRSILMPIIFIIILGMALNQMFENPKIDKINVAYLNLDKGAASQGFEQFIQMSDIKKVLNVNKVSSFSEGRKLVTEKKAASLIIIPEGYSDKIISGKKDSIEIYNSKYADFKSSIVKNIVECFNSVGNTQSAMSLNNAAKVAYNRYSVMTENSISIKGKRPRAIDYYAVSILVLAIMSSSLFACSSIGEDYFEAVGVRIKSTPLRKYENFLGKLIGCVCTSLIKAGIIIAFSKFVYGANYGSNWGMISLIVFTTSVMSCAFGMMMCMLIGNTVKASTIISILINVFTFIAGGYAAIIGADKSESMLMHLSPNLYAQTALFNTIYPNGFKAAYQFFTTQGYILQMWYFAIIMFVVLFLAERRRTA